MQFRRPILRLGRLAEHSLIVMYQSIPSLTIPLRIAQGGWSGLKPPGKFLKGRVPHPLSTKKVRNPDPWGRKIVPKSHPPGQLFLKIQKRNTKHEIEIVKNSTEALICLEILKQLKDKSPKLLGGWPLWIFKVSQIILHSSFNNTRNS